MTPNVFQYSDPVAFLNDAFGEKKKRNAKFSVRSWARALGIKEPTTLSQILNSKRPIPIHYAVKFSKNFSFNESESQYIEAIIGASAAKGKTEKTLWSKRAQKLRVRSSFKVKRLEDFRYYENPLNMILLCLADTKGFSEKGSEVARLLSKAYSPQEIEETLAFLINQGHLRKDERGNWIRTDHHLSSKDDIPSLSVKKFHEQSLKDAIDALYSQGIDDREFGSSVFNVKKSNLPRIKKKIRRFMADLLAQYTEEEGGDSVYQLNVNLFSRTRAGAP